MLGKASSSQAAGSLSGSGALSHVYVQHPPLRCSVPGASGLYYDDGNKLLLSPTVDQVYSWKTAPYSPYTTPSVDSIGEGPVLSIHYSLDGKVIGIQRSNHEIQFVNRGTGDMFMQRCGSESESILGFFWTDCPSCDVVFIKTSGLELYAYEPALRALRMVETKRLNISWYIYTHESRLLLLASGMQCRTFTGFQFSFGGLIRLPRFEMAMTKAEANNKPVLGAEDVHIITVYGRIYCLQVDRVAMLLHLYRFYRDAVVPQGYLPIYSSKIAVSVIDNVLLIHQVDAKVIILYDIFSDCQAPISAPLPLLLRGLPRINTSSSQSTGKDTAHIIANDLGDHEGTTYGDGWMFLVPDFVCDTVHCNLWRIHLDLEAIAASSSEVPSVLEFLQRRKLEPNKVKQLCLALTRTLILERRPVPMVSRALDVLVASFSHSLKIGSNVQGRSIEGDQSNSGNQRAGGSRAIVNESISRDEHGKSVCGPSRGPDNESQKFKSVRVDNESINRTTGSLMNRLLTCSDPEDSTNQDLTTRISGAGVGQSPSHSQTLAMGVDTFNSSVSGQRESQVVSSAISPDEMYTSVFSLVEEEMTGDPAYLIAIIVEYFRSAALEKLKVNPNLNVMIIQLLARSERFEEVDLFVVNKIVEPSKEVALQLIESGRQNYLTRKLGMDMLRHLQLHHDYVLLLVQDGYYLEALRYARRHKVNTVRPSLFLEAAFTSNDSQHLAAVLRFFTDFIPGFKNTLDHSIYCRILSEMNPSIAA
ncbi:hypothetical protein Sjap_012253 [Stephania japonica]|uniref:Mic1 domain-containing protein n=1 Tax=Stephania japonica TaxID=461633 RepID=A0AAP0P058_9MAGN